MSINRNTIVIAKDDILTTPIDDDLGLMNIEMGYYYTLNHIGKSIWNLIESRKSIHELVDLLLRDYDIDYESCEKDVVQLLEALVKHNLVKVCNLGG